MNGALTVNPAALTITANDDSKTYNGSPYSGGNGVTYNGFANGETADVLNGTLTYGGTSQGAILVGSYGIDPLGLTSSSYNITFISGILTINAAPVYPDQTAIDTQSGFNGTGQTSVGSPGAPNTFFVGPGAGSGAIQTAQLFTMPIGGNATLSTSTLSSPVSFSAEGQTTTLTVTQTAASDPMAAIGTLPLFVQEAGASPALRGNFTVRESTSAISLTEAATTNAGIAEPPAADLTGLSPIPFTLTLENGMALQLTVMVTRDGVLMVSAPASTGSIDIRQAILMGAQIAKQELKTALRNLKAAVLVRR